MVFVWVSISSVISDNFANSNSQDLLPANQIHVLVSLLLALAIAVPTVTVHLYSDTSCNNQATSASGAEGSCISVAFASAQGVTLNATSTANQLTTCFWTDSLCQQSSVCGAIAINGQCYPSPLDGKSYMFTWSSASSFSPSLGLFVVAFAAYLIH